MWVRQGTLLLNCRVNHFFDMYFLTSYLTEVFLLVLVSILNKQKMHAKIKLDEVTWFLCQGLLFLWDGIVMPHLKGSFISLRWHCKIIFQVPLLCPLLKGLPFLWDGIVMSPLKGSFISVRWNWTVILHVSLVCSLCQGLSFLWDGIVLLPFKGSSISVSWNWKIFLHVSPLSSLWRTPMVQRDLWCKWWPLYDAMGPLFDLRFIDRIN